MTDLRNARIIEVGTPEQNGILIRARRGDPFTRLGGVADGEKVYEEEVRRADRVAVLAEFPLALADMVPDGCTEFRFKDKTHRCRVAMRHPGGQWEVTGMHGEWQDLNALQFDCDANVLTVIPLQVSDQYVEERR